MGFSTAFGQQTSEEIASGSPQEMIKATALLEREGIAIPQSVDIILGDPQTLFWRNLIPVRDPGVFNYKVSCTCNFFEEIGRGVRLAPDKEALGPHRMNISVLGEDNLEISEIAFDIVVRQPDANAEGRDTTILFVGDSLGHQSRFPNAVAAGLEKLENTSINYIGTHRPVGSNIPHEQYGGWTFKRFLVGFDFDRSIYHTEQSPFVFPPESEGGEPKFDMARYFSERVSGVLPDIIHIQLGINDGFLLDPTDLEGMEVGINAILANADQLVAAFREAVPSAVISLGTVIPANGDNRAYIESYPTAPNLHSEWRWRQVQNRMVRRMMAHFSSREDEGVHILPTHLFLDTFDGYFPRPFIASGTDNLLTNAVHPNEFGDRQVAAPIHAHMHRVILGTLQ